MVELDPKLQAELDRTKPASLDREDPARRAFVDITDNYLAATPNQRMPGNPNRELSYGVTKSALATLPTITESTVRDYAANGKLAAVDTERLTVIFNDVAKGDYIDFAATRETSKPMRAAQEQFYKDVNATKELIGIRTSTPEGRFTTLSAVTVDIDYLEKLTLEGKRQYPDSQRVGEILPKFANSLQKEAYNLTPEDFLKRLQGAREGIATEYAKTAEKVQTIRAEAPAPKQVESREVEKGSFNQVAASVAQILDAIMVAAGQVIKSALGR